MTGTVYAVLSTFCGLDLSGEIPVLSPNLPDLWKGLQFSFEFQNTKYSIDITKGEMKIAANNNGKEKIKIDICKKIYKLENNKALLVEIN